MESKHVTGKLKSSFLITLIFSYFDYFEFVKRILKLLSKNGVVFVQNNEQQLMFFCQKRNRLEKEVVPRACIMNISKRIKSISQIEIFERTDFTSLEESLQGVETIERVILSCSESKKLYFSDCEESQLSKILGKAICIEVSSAQWEYLFFRQLLKHSEQLEKVQKLDLRLNITTNIGEALKKLKNVSEISIRSYRKIRETGLLIEQFAESPSHQITKFALDINLSYFCTKTLEECQARMLIVLPKLTQNLRCLKLNMLEQTLLSFQPALEQLEHLQVLKLRTDLFYLSCLKFWPRLVYLHLQYNELIQPPEQKIVLSQLNKLKLIHGSIPPMYNQPQKSEQTALCEQLLIDNAIGVKEIKFMLFEQIDILVQNSQICSKLRVLKILQIKKFQLSMFSSITKLKVLKILELQFNFTQFQDVISFDRAKTYEENSSIEEVSIDFYSAQHPDQFIKLKVLEEVSHFLKQLKRLRKLTEIDELFTSEQYSHFFKEILRITTLLHIRLEGNNKNKYQYLLLEMQKSKNSLLIVELLTTLNFDDISILTKTLKKNHQIQSLIIHSWANFQVDIPLNKLFSGIQHLPNLRNLQFGINIGEAFKRGYMKKILANTLVLERQHLFHEITAKLLNDLSSIVIKNCGNMRELRIKVENNLIQLNLSEKEILKLKQQFLQNVIVFLPHLDILLI